MTPGLARLLRSASILGRSFAHLTAMEDFVFKFPLERGGDAWEWRHLIEQFLNETGPHLKEIYFHKAAIERQVPNFRHDEDLTSAREALAALAEAIAAGHADPKPFVEARRKRCLLYNPHGTQEVWRTTCYDEVAIRATLPRELVLQWIERYEALALADTLSE